MLTAISAQAEPEALAAENGDIEVGAALPEGPLKVCYAPLPGFFEPDGDGSFEGLEFDLISTFVDELGVEVTYQDPGDLAGTFRALEEATCDVAAANLTRTEERARKMDFSPTYFPVRILAVERKGSLTTRKEELAGRRIAVVRESTYEDAVASIPDVRMVPIHEAYDGFTEVLDGRADVAVCDSTLVLHYLDRYPDLTVTIPLSEREEMAFALPKNSPWTPLLSQFLDSWRDSGRLHQLYACHYGEEGAKLLLE